MGRSIVIAAGRPTPGQSNQRGVAIVLSGLVMDTRKKGEQWKAWGSRLIRVTLGTGMRSSDHLYVLSCYAPAFSASRDVKEAFFDNLQHALIGIAATRRVVCVYHAGRL